MITYTDSGRKRYTVEKRKRFYEGGILLSGSPNLLRHCQSFEIRNSSEKDFWITAVIAQPQQTRLENEVDGEKENEYYSIGLLAVQPTTGTKGRGINQRLYCITTGDYRVLYEFPPKRDKEISFDMPIRKNTSFYLVVVNHSKQEQNQERVFSLEIYSRNDTIYVERMERFHTPSQPPPKVTVGEADDKTKVKHHEICLVKKKFSSGCGKKIGDDLTHNPKTFFYVQENTSFYVYLCQAKPPFEKVGVYVLRNAIQLKKSRTDDVLEKKGYLDTPELGLEVNVTDAPCFLIIVGVTKLKKCRKSVSIRVVADWNVVDHFPTMIELLKNKESDLKSKISINLKNLGSGSKKSTSKRPSTSRGTKLKKTNVNLKRRSISSDKGEGSGRTVGKGKGKRKGRTVGKGNKGRTKILKKKKVESSPKKKEEEEEEQSVIDRIRLKGVRVFPEYPWNELFEKRNVLDENAWNRMAQRDKYFEIDHPGKDTQKTSDEIEDESFNLLSFNNLSTNLLLSKIGTYPPETMKKAIRIFRENNPSVDPYTQEDVIYQLFKKKEFDILEYFLSGKVEYVERSRNKKKLEEEEEEEEENEGESDDDDEEEKVKREAYNIDWNRTKLLKKLKYEKDEDEKWEIINEEGLMSMWHPEQHWGTKFGYHNGCINRAENKRYFGKSRIFEKFKEGGSYSCYRDYVSYWESFVEVWMPLDRKLYDEACEKYTWMEEYEMERINLHGMVSKDQKKNAWRERFIMHKLFMHHLVSSIVFGHLSIELGERLLSDVIDPRYYDPERDDLRYMFDEKHKLFDAFMMFCCENGSIESLKLLLSERFNTFFDPSCKNNYPIRIAAKKGRYDIVKFLLEKETVDYKSNDYEAFFSCIENERLEILKDLLLPRIEEEEEEKKKLIHRLIIHSIRFDQLEIFHYLLDKYGKDCVQWDELKKNPKVELLVYSHLQEDERIWNFMKTSSHNLSCYDVTSIIMTLCTLEDQKKLAEYYICGSDSSVIEERITSLVKWNLRTPGIPIEFLEYLLEQVERLFASSTRIKLTTSDLIDVAREIKDTEICNCVFTHPVFKISPPDLTKNNNEVLTTAWEVQNYNMVDCLITNSEMKEHVKKLGITRSEIFTTFMNNNFYYFGEQGKFHESIGSLCVNIVDSRGGYNSPRSSKFRYYTLKLLLGESQMNGMLEKDLKHIEGKMKKITKLSVEEKKVLDVVRCQLFIGEKYERERKMYSVDFEERKGFLVEEYGSSNNNKSVVRVRVNGQEFYVLKLFL